jgi:TolA-binding protein
MQSPFALTTHSPSKFEQTLHQGVAWIRAHQEQSWAIAGTAVGAVLLVFFMINRRQAENESAWSQLGAAQGPLLQGQFDQASKALEEWSARYKGTSADSYARFIRAELYYQTKNYAGAAKVYAELAGQGDPAELRPLALAAESSAEEMAGHLAEAQSAAQRFLDKYPEHFLAASMYLAQARLAEMTGNTANAAAIYDRFAILYPQSSLAPFAKFRLEKLPHAAAPASATPAPVPLPAIKN